MAVRAFGIGRARNEGQRWLLASVLMATTALVMTPKAEAAGEIVDPSSPGAPYYHYDIPALSADGRIYIANIFYPDISRWSGAHVTPDGTTTVPAFSDFLARVRGMSGDGRFVVGASVIENGYGRAFRWDTGTSEMLDLGLLYPAIPNAWAEAWDVSGNGDKVVGSYTRPGMTRGFVWIENATTGIADNEQIYQLQGLTAASSWSAYAISDDGNFAVGESNGDATTGLAVRWDLRGLEAGGVGSDILLNLGSLSGIDSGESTANDVSADGRVVVGVARDGEGGRYAFRWVEGATGGVVDNPQMYSLGTLYDGQLGASSNAYAVSRDGSVVVGVSGWDLGALAFRWTEESGMESVEDWLARHDVDVGDYYVWSATAVSDNGQVIAGTMDINGETRAYIARVTEAPGPGPGPGPGGGLMDVAEYHATLYSAAGIAQTGELLTWLPMNGAHHRPLMLTPDLSGDMCAWATGDFAHHGGSSTGLALAEIGACADLAGGSMRIGGTVGTAGSWQDLALGGSARMQGQYVLSEIDWQPDGTPLLVSLTGMLGSYQAHIERAYSNGAATAMSSGDTQAVGGVVRLRADWLEAARIGNTSINPYAALGFGGLQVNGYSESGGPFPAVFNAQTLGHADIRLGVTAVTEFSTQTRLSTTLEVAHRTGTAPQASGNVPGLFDFSLGGGSYLQTWARVGLEFDHAVSDHLSLSTSAHLASNGRDPSIAASSGIKGSF